MSSSVESLVRDSLSVSGSPRGLEPFVLDYLASVACASLSLWASQSVTESEADFTAEEELSDALGEFLLTYEVVDSEEEVLQLCARICGEYMPRFMELAREKLREEREAEKADKDKGMRMADSSHAYKAHRERRSRRDRAVLDDPERFGMSAKLNKKKEKEKALAEMTLKKNSERVKKEVKNALTLSESILSGGGGAARGNAKNISVVGFSLYPIDGGEPLLTEADLKFASGRRYGLIGRNGIGKSTLLRAIALGEIRGFPKDVRTVHVQQEIEGDDRTALEFVLDADVEMRKLFAEEKAILESVEQSEDRLTEIHERLKEIDAWSAESRACTILAGLQFSEDMMKNLKTKELSGGWRMRVALASALFVDPELLLLDEPTNHLDFPAVIFLEGFLQKYKNTVVIVSHDRFFVNNVVTDIVHFRNKTLTYYRGDYNAFERSREEKQRQAEKQAESHELKKLHIQKFIDRFRYNANRAALVQSRIKTLNKLASSADFLSDLNDDPDFKFEFPSPEPISKILVSVDEGSFGYPNGPLLLKNLSLRVDLDSRIGILGKNGSGKTTLLKMMMGELEPLTGSVHRNRSARISLFSQHHVDQLDLRLSPYDYILSLHPTASEQEIRSHLGRYGLNAELVSRQIGKLSGGQRSRVSFAATTWNNPHLLILDEPTNHCDLETVDALLFAISMFEGGVVSVSHDQHFLMNAATEFWAVADKQINVFYTLQEAKSFTYRSQI